MSVMQYQNLNESELETALNISRRAIRNLLFNGVSEPPDGSNYSGTLAQPRSCFVTLTDSGALQGCQGSVFPALPLAEEIHDKTVASAQLDRRFPPLQKHQLNTLTIEVSILSVPDECKVDSEEALLSYLDKHRVGVILSEGRRRAVFLPQVWEQVPSPAEFMMHLKRKGGWDDDYWSDTLTVKTFTVESIEGPFKK